MPNWVFNHMRVARKDVHKVFRFNVNEIGQVEGVVDFEQAVPMPTSLDIKSSSDNDYQLYFYLSERLTLTKEQIIEKVEKLGFGLKIDNIFSNAFSDNWFAEIAERAEKRAPKMSDSEMDIFVKNGETLIFNLINYGVCSWYDWRCIHWGCKWNACNSEISEQESDEEDVVVYFETPWGPPTAWCQALARLGVDFSLDWEEEQGYRGEIYGCDGEYGEEELPFREDEFEDEDED